MNLCTNCFYCQKYDAEGIMRPAEFWQCSQVLITNQVDGSTRYANCAIERTRMNADFVECGESGKLFVDRKEREREINYDQFREPLRRADCDESNEYACGESNDD